MMMNEMNDKEIQVAMATASTTVESILFSIKHNGLEKTLQDLHEVVPELKESPNKEFDQNAYKGMLQAVMLYRTVKKMIQTAGEEEDMK